MAEFRRKRRASQATVGACKAKFGGINASDARPLRALWNIPPVEVAVKMRLETLAA